MNLVGNIIAQRLHEVVQNGKLGYDYAFDRKRDKNHLLRAKYYVNDSKMIDILLEFKIVEKLMPRYEEESDYVDVCIYIKITWPDGQAPMFIISFHEDEEQES